jgi:hypothetical protein
MSGQTTGSESLMTEELISRARAGDAVAFQQLTASHRRELHVHCYRSQRSAGVRRVCALCFGRRPRDRRHRRLPKR